MDTRQDFAQASATTSIDVLAGAPELTFEAFLAQAPAAPGVVALTADSTARSALGLMGDTPNGTDIVAVIAAPEGLDSRHVRQPFQSGRTGQSSIRSALAGLLAQTLELEAEHASPGVQSGLLPLTAESEDRLSAWMRAHLSLRLAVTGSGDQARAAAADVVGTVRPLLGDDAHLPGGQITERWAALKDSSRESATL